MKVRLHFLTLALVLTSAALSAQSALPQLLYSVDISPLITPGQEIYRTGALAFVNDHTLAVSICNNVGCTLETLELAEGKPRVIARTGEFEGYFALFRAPDGNIVLDHARSPDKQGSVVLDSNLSNARLISGAKITGRDISVTGETFVRQGDHNRWSTYKLAAPAEPIHSGVGLVLAVSDDAIVYIDQGAIHIDRFDGKSPVSSAGLPYKRIPTIGFVGTDLLWFDDGTKTELRDLSGNTLRKLDRFNGGSARFGQSSDGARILYDQHVRNISSVRKTAETVFAVATLGMSVGDEAPNGEVVRVIEVNSGKPCFDWRTKTDVLSAGGFHADISPSGQLVAVMTRSTLNLYRLPDLCIAQ